MMVFIDLETTGLSITQDRIVQIACVKDGVLKKIMLNPTIPIPEGATGIHGITDEDVKDCPTFKQLSVSLNEYFEGCDICGYNSNSYDIPLLMEEFNRVGIDFDLTGRKLADAYEIECKINSRKLAAVYKRMTGKDMEDAHDAGADALATKEIFELQLGMITEEEIYADAGKFLDVTKKLYKNDKGDICWTFGKNKDLPIANDRGYCNWVLKGDFTKQVKDIIKQTIF